VSECLGVDVGNTRVKLYRFPAAGGAPRSIDSLRPLVRRVELSGERSVASVLAALATVPAPLRVHIVSVDRSLSEPLAAALAAAGRAPLHWGRERELPIAHDYEAPGRPGDDRLLLAWTAGLLLGAPPAAIVVGAGTALTVDLVRHADGRFRFAGGAIAPGAPAASAGLARRTAQLFEVGLGLAARWPGTSTKACLEIGLAHAFAGTLRSLIAAASPAAPGAPIVVAGGDAELAARALADHAPIVERDLLGLGLALLESRHGA
jgi:pantothenate kinase type III